MTALLPRDLVVDIVACVRRLGGLGDCLTTTEQFFLAEELRTSAGPLIQRALLGIRAVKSSILERNVLRIGDVFAL
jgi:hypothetical protein